MSNLEKGRITRSQVFKTGLVEFLKSKLPGWSAENWEKFKNEETLQNVRKFEEYLDKVDPPRKQL